MDYQSFMLESDLSGHTNLAINYRIESSALSILSLNDFNNLFFVILDFFFESVDFHIQFLNGFITTAMVASGCRLQNGNHLGLWFLCLLSQSSLPAIILPPSKTKCLRAWVVIKIDPALNDLYRWLVADGCRQPRLFLLLFKDWAMQLIWEILLLFWILIRYLPSGWSNSLLDEWILLQFLLFYRLIVFSGLTRARILFHDA